MDPFLLQQFPTEIHSSKSTSTQNDPNEKNMWKKSTNCNVNMLKSASEIPLTELRHYPDDVFSLENENTSSVWRVC